MSSNYHQIRDSAIQYYNLTGSVCATRSNCSTGAETLILRWHYEEATGRTSDARSTYPQLNPNHLYRFRLLGFGNLAGPGQLNHKFNYSTPPLPPGIIPFIARIDCF